MQPTQNNTPHQLYKDGDANIPVQILDQEEGGQVCLDLCKVCGQAENTLTEFCPGPAGRAAAQPAPLADGELAALVKLNHYATAGPWELDGDADDDSSWSMLLPAGGKARHAAGDYCDLGNVVDSVDAELIIAMRNALPGLLARVRAAEARLSTVQIDVPGGVATVSFEEADMYGGLTEWLRAKGYIGKNEDGEDETEDDITHWAGPNVTREHYATLVENNALLAFKEKIVQVLAEHRDKAQARADYGFESIETFEASESNIEGAAVVDSLNWIASLLSLTLPDGKEADRA